MTTKWVWGLAIVPLAGVPACSDRFGVGDCNAEGTCVGAAGGADSVGDDSADSGASGVNGDDGRGAVACNGDVADDPECWTNNEHAVFVSNETGNDETGEGTKEAPYESINEALDRAAGKKVFVCLGTTTPVYEEEVIIDASRDGAAIYGGFECEGWTYRASRKPSLVSTTSVGLRIADLKQGVHIENFRIAAQDAQGAGLAASSYGVFITGSQGVELTNVEVKAGRGADGADGAAGAVGKSGDDFGSAPIGTDAICFSPDAPPSVSGGAWSKASACGSMGGGGGTAEIRPAKAKQYGEDGADGAPTLHVLGTASTGNGGGGESSSNQILDGNPGANGESGSSGDPALEFGAFAEGGFATADGSRGTDGYPGQGGGGGGASVGTTSCYGASGGAGGMGGCGGVAGGAGMGGGASVGLFVWDAQVTLDQCKISAVAGGRGGAGGAGGLAGIGASGGAGGLPVSSFLPGGRGGLGGNGGLGGSGSGGTGGPSIALVWFGEKPLHDASSTTFVAGSGGNGGEGGKRGATQAPGGAQGASLAELLVP